MSAIPDTGAANTGFPRFFRIAGYSVNSYKFFLCIGIYVGTLATAALASLSGLSPLRVGLAAMTCALAGLIGARVYYLLVHARFYLRQRSLAAVWDSSRGGWSLFGSLLTFIPASFAAAAWLHVPARRPVGSHGDRRARRRLLDQARLRVQRLLRRPGNQCVAGRPPARHVVA